MLASAFRKFSVGILVFKPVSTRCLARVCTEPRVPLFLHSSSVFHLKLLHQQVLFTFKTGQRTDNSIWRVIITEFNQITPLWVCLSRTDYSRSHWVRRAKGKHPAFDLSSLCNSVSPGFQMLKLSRRIQISFSPECNSTEVTLLACAEAGVGPGSFSNVCLGLPKFLSLFLALKTLKTFCIRALKGTQEQAGFAASLYSCNIGVFVSNFVLL